MTTSIIKTKQTLIELIKKVSAVQIILNGGEEAIKAFRSFALSDLLDRGPSWKDIDACIPFINVGVECTPDEFMVAVERLREIKKLKGQ